jgi:predicted RNA-binding Zn-ribbon protein involved in translation (DUF1610 family)
MTVNAVPSTPALGQKAAIPLGCILQPMAPSDEVRGRLSIRERERERDVGRLAFFLQRQISAASNHVSMCRLLGVACLFAQTAHTTHTQHKIPVVNFGRTGIIRCRKCRAYINPFVNFLEGGRRWRCNLCDLVNETPNDYFSELDRNGRRKDWAERAELSKGCVEFVAPSEYMVR